jgi:succinylglutamate desuccinylase
MLEDSITDIDSNHHLIFSHLGAVGRPLIILMGSIHGDEAAGTAAIEMLIHHLPIDELDCNIVGLCGNIEALKAQSRYILKDLNRVWSKENITKVTNSDPGELKHELLELYRILHLVDYLVAMCKPSSIYYLDMHTTSSDGSVFCILPAEEDCKAFAEKLSLPLVHDMLINLDDTTLHYFSTENLGIPTIALAFEGGHHKDPFSVYRCYATIMRFIAATGLANGLALTDNDYDHMLDNYFEKMPHETYVKYRYNIEESRFFEMRPGYKHFSPVKKDEIIARYDGQHIKAPQDGYVLMPLYQKKGSDGFFIVTENR